MAVKSRKKTGGTGTAGRGGPDVRSDLRVEVELSDAGGIQLDLRSRVEPYYGDAIREQVAAVLAALGVEHARVAIDDRGGLPFVIAARLEAAARAAGADPARDARPERVLPLPPASARDRLPRRAN